MQDWLLAASSWVSLLSSPPPHTLTGHKGFVEAPYYPGALYLLSIFYTRKELASRIALLYTGQVVSTGCSGLIAAACFATLDGVHGIAGWRWLFIIEGVVTFGVATIGLLLLCDDPSETKWLTPEERATAVARIQKDTVGAQGRASVWSGLRQACTDPKLLLFVLMQNLHISACSFNNFFPTIVNSLGFDSKITALLLTAPPYFVSGLLGIPVA
jgi:MFS family permease